ncbi:MAG: FtsH protease activity modulator HflK [Halorhodospira sp.]
MAWNEPGGGGRDPWGGGPKGGGSGGPPDLDELLRKLRQRMDGLLGGRMPGGSPGAMGVGLLVLAGFVVWILTGIYIVDQGWRGVELTFGRHTQTTEPGPHWHWPAPIGEIDEVNVERRRIAEVGYASAGSNSRSVSDEALMVTRDENIVDLRLAAQYAVKDPALYLFNFRAPERTLKQVTESAVREVIGKRELEYVLTEGRTEVANRTGELLQQVLSEYRTGLEVVQVAVQDIQPPEPVQPAFEDAIRAREDKQSIINEAQAYANELIPRAQGQVARVLEQAEGYRQEVIARAEGDAARFEALIPQYRDNPEVMRQRMYLETMEQVLGGMSKAVLDTASSQSLMYLPLDKLMDRRSGASAGSGSQGSGSSSAGLTGDGEADLPEGRDAITPTQRARQALRERGTL